MPNEGNARSTNVSARHVFEVLRRICGSDRPLGAAEIHQLLNLPSSTIHRALASLEQEGFIARYRGLPKYVIGPNPQHLAHVLFSLFPMRCAFHRLLRQVATADRQTVLLTVRLGWYGMKVAVFEGTNEVFHAGALGETKLLTDDDVGHAMLNAMGREELNSVHEFLRHHFPGSGKRLSWERLGATAAAARADGGEAAPILDQAGWAWHHLPLLDANRRVVAAVSGGAPADADAAGTADRRLQSLRDAITQMELRLRMEPQLAWSPFEHLAPGDILLQSFSPEPVVT